MSVPCVVCWLRAPGSRLYWFRPQSLLVSVTLLAYLVHLLGYTQTLTGLPAQLSARPPVWWRAMAFVPLYNPIPLTSLARPAECPAGHVARA